MGELNGVELFEKFVEQADPSCYGVVFVPLSVSAMDLFHQARSADIVECYLNANLSVVGPGARVLLFRSCSTLAGTYKFWGHRFQWMWIEGIDDPVRRELVNRLRPGHGSDRLWLNVEPYHLTSQEIFSDIVRNAAIMNGPEVGE